MENLRIGVIGNIGVGKSTLVEALKLPPFSLELLNHFPSIDGDESVHSFKEHFSNNVLDAFYQDPKKHALIAQLEFFNGRLKRQYEIEQARGIVLEDRTIFEDYHVFGKAQKIMGHMNALEFEVYQNNYNLMMQKIEEPTLLVYLRADVDTIMGRIQKRGRECERNIPRPYIELLNSLYETFISRHTSSPVLVIDARPRADLNAYLRETVDKISLKIRELDLRVCTPGLQSWVRLPETEAAIRASEAEQRLEEYLKKNKKLITVSGNVGLGKSTVAALMQRSLRIDAIFENPEKNPLLNLFLRNKKEHCFDLQYHFLQMRAEQRRRGLNSATSMVKDRSLAEDLLVFCQHFHQSGYLTENQLDLLSTEFHKINKELPSSDLMIVLQGRPELAWKRIQQRGRAMEVEGGWGFSDIQSLHRFYSSYPDDVRKTGFHQKQVLELNVNKLDLANRVHMGYIFEQVLEAFKR
ncbi:MAG: deoxynucleoside kinase [Gammaproteobacteria bacterium]|nr:deoxynucleoside kinase [Gammaproteobacteria bacterium]